MKDGDIVSVKADNERGTIFNQVKIRVDDSFTLEMHIDTDEAMQQENCHRQYCYNYKVMQSGIFFLITKIKMFSHAGSGSTDSAWLC